MSDTLKDKSTSLLRIGLALSGGGFRASIFHLGVIRRLEELGIMKYVHVISAVSGGSIIAAYYVIEMEKHLRRRRAELGENPERLDEVRLQIFEEIADCFFQALDHNLRSRALVFSPFYHPILWVKSYWPTLSRSDISRKNTTSGSIMMKHWTICQRPHCPTTRPLPKWETSLLSSPDRLLC